MAAILDFRINVLVACCIVHSDSYNLRKFRPKIFSTKDFRAQNVFCHFCWDLPIRGDFGVVLGELCPHFKFFIGETPKRHFLGKNHVVWAINCENRFRRLGCRRSREKGKGRKSRFKKAQNGYISRICGDGCTEPILMKFGKLRYTCDVINPAEFYLIRFSGFWLAMLWSLGFP